MARIRSVKPEFWIDEKIVDLGPWARLLFIGLWTFADDQGYVDDKPKRIKLQVFPGDDVDVEPLLDELVAAGLCVRYDSPVGPVLHVRNWDKHQRVDKAGAKRFEPSELIPAKSRGGSRKVSSPREGSRASLATEGSRSGSGVDLDLDLESITARAPARSRDDAEFDRFWETYPRKADKPSARKAWNKAIRTVDPDRILAGARRYREDPNREQQYTKHPTTWINNACWDDDPQPARSRASPNGHSTGTTRAETAIEAGHEAARILNLKEIEQ